MPSNEFLFEWKDEYNIGVENIDNAHRQLFRMVSRVIESLNDADFDKNKIICIEAIKYLKNYTVKHFAEEEKYQLEVGHRGYHIHKRLHDNMRDVVIPALEKEMALKSYSKESIQHFIGVCAGWLSAHVLVEDRAIVGKTKSKWSQSVDANKFNILNDIVRGYASTLFSVNAELFSKTYSGHKLNEIFCYNDVFEMPNGLHYSITTAMEHPLLEMIARGVAKKEVIELDAVILPLLSEIFKSFHLEVILAFFNSAPSKRIGSQGITASSFYEQYEKNHPDYSMLWQTYKGQFAVNIKIMEN